MRAHPKLSTSREGQLLGWGAKSGTKGTPTGGCRQDWLEWEARSTQPVDLDSKARMGARSTQLVDLGSTAKQESRFTHLVDLGCKAWREPRSL